MYHIVGTYLRPVEEDCIYSRKTALGLGLKSRTLVQFSVTKPTLSNASAVSCIWLDYL